MPRNPKQLTNVRGAVHGNFDEGAGITQRVMAIFQTGSQWPKLSDAQKEALHMIVHKSHRIVTGNPSHTDHWEDIAGYAHLGIPGNAAKARKPARAAKKPAKPRKAKKAKAVPKAVKLKDGDKEAKNAARRLARKKKLAAEARKKDPARKKLAKKVTRLPAVKKRATTTPAATTQAAA